MQDCLFCKIINSEIPADIVFEDDDTVAFKDINPIAPIHVLIIPKEHVTITHDLTDKSVASKLLVSAGAVARALGLCEKGYRLVINNGKAAGQVIDHLHIHLLAGRGFGWPPG